MLPITYSNQCAPKTAPYLVNIKGGDGRKGLIYFTKSSKPVRKVSCKSKETFLMSFHKGKTYTVPQFIFTSTNENINLSY